MIPGHWIRYYTWDLLATSCQWMSWLRCGRLKSGRISRSSIYPRRNSLRVSKVFVSRMCAYISGILWFLSSVLLLLHLFCPNLDHLLCACCCEAQSAITWFVKLQIHHFPATWSWYSYIQSLSRVTIPTSASNRLAWMEPSYTRTWNTCL